MTHTQTQGADGAGTFDHEFKSHPAVFWPAARGEKTFEYRRDDRGGYEIGQTVRLRCFDPAIGYEDVAPLDRRITNILRGGEFELPQGFCILSLAPLASRSDSAEVTALEEAFAAAACCASCATPSDCYQGKPCRLETDAEAAASTPAPAATPGVPDSLRALSEAARQGEWKLEELKNHGASASDQFMSYGIDCGGHTILDTLNSGGGLLEQEPADDDIGPFVWDEQARRDLTFIVELVKAYRSGALIAAQPAGQAGDAGIEATQITLGEGMVDITRIDHEGRTGVLFRPRKERIPFGEPGELPEGTYWPVKGDVVLWVSGEGPGVAIKALADLAPNSTRTGQEKDTFFTSDGFSADLIEAPRSRLPALNSTRTGAAEPCLRAVVEVYSGRTDTRLTFGKSVKHEGGCKAVEQAIIALQAELDQRDACPAAGGPSAGYGGTGAKALSAAILAQCAYPRICSSNGRVAEGIRCGPCERKALAAALAARPEAPSDAAETEEDWREDPSADERWCAGVDYAQEQLCHVLGVDPSDVNWDAATETLDGDTQAVICTILAAWGGDDWQAPDSTRTGDEGTEDFAAWLAREAKENREEAAQLASRGDYSSANHFNAKATALDEAATALAARPEAPSDAGKGRPIDTAPKDRSEILLFGTIARSRTKPSWFIGAWFPTGEHGDGWWVSSCVEVIASAWAPLPTPPSDPSPSGQAEG